MIVTEKSLIPSLSSIPGITVLVVDAIGTTQTGPQDRPVRDAVIERIEVP